MMGVPIYANDGMGGLNHSYGYANQNPLIYTDPTGETPAHALRGALWAGGRIGAGINYAVQAALGVSLGVALHDALNGSIPIDVNNPILPGVTLPTDASVGTMQCPTNSQPPFDPEEQCVNAANIAYSICIASSATTLAKSACHARRVSRILMCKFGGGGGFPGGSGGMSPGFEG